MEDFVKIRELYFKDGLAIKAIARQFHYARGTVRKAVREWDGEVRYQLSKPRPRPAATPEVYEFARAILVADKKAPRKQRHTAHRIWSRIRGEKPTWSIGESTVRGLVRQIRQELRERPPITIPLAFDPGEEAQVDFGEAFVEMQGEQVKAHLLFVTLCYSRRVFAMAFPSPNQEAFLAGQVQAFHHFGGVVGRIAYDNPKVAVIKVLLGGREENETFKAFRGLYCYEPRFCTPGIEGAHEKGRVERRVGTYRSNELVPLPVVDSWAQLNEYLRERCLELDGKAHPEQGERTIREVFEDERAHLRPLPRFDFVCAASVCVRVDSHSRVVYKGVRYSVPVEYGRREVEVRAFWDRVDIYSQTKLIASWPRSYRPGEEHYDYSHYLKLLKYTPGAALNGKPFRQLPEILLRYRKELLDRYERRQAGRCLASVLKLLMEEPEEKVLDGVELAMLSGTVDADAVRNVVHQLIHGPRKPVEKLDLSGRASLRQVTVRPVNLSRYNALIGGSTA